MCLCVCVCVCVCVLSHSVVSHSLLCHELSSTRRLCPRHFPSKNTGAGCHFLIQGISSNQGSNWIHVSCDSLPLHHLGSWNIQYVFHKCMLIFLLNSNIWKQKKKKKIWVHFIRNLSDTKILLESQYGHFPTFLRNNVHGSSNSSFLLLHWNHLSSYDPIMREEGKY